ncbi:MAG: acyl-CoA dehydrogenase family protein [Microthrixaceae bacterium]
MDFDLTDEQSAVTELAAQLLGDLSSPDALRAVEHRDPDRFDRDLWSAMAEAGLLGLCVPAECGGAGLGLLEVCTVLREVGRRTAAVPAFAALALGALPVARHGTPAQQERLLVPLMAGESIVTAAVSQPGGDHHRPSVVARRDGASWLLDGSCSNVWAGTLASTVLVPAKTDDGPAVFVVDVGRPGVQVEAQATTTGTPQALITMVAAEVGADDVLGSVDRGAEMLDDLIARATVASCAVMSGVAAEAVRLTGAYTTERHQFGRPLAGFQAVTQRAGDAYVDAQAIELTMLQAAWRLDADLPAEREVAVAKFFAAEAGQRVVHAAQHLHGGMGVDRDYPLHRYFLLAKQLELFLGGASRQLLRLGALLADDGPAR